jgi:DNA-binding MarR family transcriptional regulator
VTDSGDRTPAGFTYDDETATDDAATMLNLLLEYRDAEEALRRRVATTLEIGDLDLLGLRYVTRASEQGTPLRPSDLRDRLHITTGSTTGLIDRLEARGFVRREPHPTDRRSSFVALDEGSTSTVVAAIDSMQSSILDVAESLSDEDRTTAVRVLRGLIAATRSSNAEPAA